MKTLNRKINKKRRLAKLVFILIYFIFPLNIKAGMKGIDIEKWQKISKTFFIDTVDFALNDTFLNFWIREKNYKKRRLTIDCKNFLEKELFEGKVYGWNGITKNTEKFVIANQLCFLTKVKGFTPEPKFRQPPWVKKVITSTKENNVKVIPKIINNKENSKTNLNSSKEINNFKNPSVLINKNNIDSENINKNKNIPNDERNYKNIEKKLIKKNLDPKSKKEFPSDFNNKNLNTEQLVIKKDREKEIQDNVDNFFSSIKNNKKKNFIFSGDSLKTDNEFLPESKDKVNNEKDNQVVQKKIMNFSN